MVSSSGEIISYLNISSARVEDGGEYTCLSKNKAGQVAHSSRLNVYGKLPRRSWNDSCCYLLHFSFRMAEPSFILSRCVFKQRIFELNKARENGRGPTVNEAAIKVCRSYRLRGFKANSLININQLS